MVRRIAIGPLQRPDFLKTNPTHCKLQPEAEVLLKAVMKKLSFICSPYERILKVARTIADLDQKPQVLYDHIAEAIQYQSLDREGWMG